MPSPSSQNLRSAPQKQPSPNTACSRPCGYGGCSLRPLTKWVAAVGIGVARPGSASAALGNAVVLRMNNMDDLQTEHRPGWRGVGRLTSIYLYADRRSPVRRTLLGQQPCWIGRPGGPVLRCSRLPGSVARIADQRLARPEQDHQQDADHAQHGKHRLVQDDLDDAVPQPGCLALQPGPERQLAGLVNIVPELPEPGETQGLVGHEAGAVIDHEDKSAGQQQQADKSEETADHASP